MKSVFLIAFSLILSHCIVLAQTTNYSTHLSNFPKEATFPFSVASGDPLHDRVIIWTKIGNQLSPCQVRWELANDSAFKQIQSKGEINTSSDNDFTVKVDAGGLNPGTKYYYRFQVNNTFSPIGITKTSSADAENIRFAVVSCSNYEAGYFNAYRSIAETENLDAIIHLGDYIYEYARNRYGNNLPERQNVPEHEIITLDDYRIRYALYRLDTDLQEMHRKHPVIAIWDDHELANNTWKDGAENHQESEGNFDARKKSAQRAYFEWLPIREQENFKIYRKFEYGSLAELFMIDGRTERDLQASTPNEMNQNPTRAILADEQFQWLSNGIKSSQSTWKIIGNDVMFSPVNYAALLPQNTSFYLDMWDGYPTNRDQLLRTLRESNIKNLIILTGDIHCSWAFNLNNDTKRLTNGFYAPSGEIIGAEFIAPSITSKSFGEYIDSGFKTRIAQKRAKKRNPHLSYLDLTRHGYMVLTINKDKVENEWYFVNTVKEKNGKINKREKIEFKKNGLRLN